MATLSAKLDDIPRKALRDSLEGREARRKPLAEAEHKRELGRAIDTALRAARIEKQAAAIEMGVDAGQISRWINGSETPQFARLWMLGDRFQRELLIALAESVPGVETRTVITLQQRVG